MKKQAYNRVVYNGREYRQAIVERDDEGNVLRVYEFTEEQPFTEWIGGSVELKYPPCPTVLPLAKKK